MPSARTRTWRARVARTTLALATIAFLAFLPFAGRYLIAEDPLERADAIVVLAGARVERWLEGVDLYREGWAPLVLLSCGRTEPAEIRLRVMGIRYPLEGELARDAMIQMKVPPEAIRVVGESLDNTAQEAASVVQAARRERWHRLIVVTSKYHTRRTGFAFRREFQGTGVTIIVRGSRHDQSPADRWWASRPSFRFVVSELAKLAAYRLGIRG